MYGINNTINLNFFGKISLESNFQADRPPERRVLTLINHGDHPVAFEVQTTDNYSYFIDVVHGIIPPRQTSVNAAIRMPNSVCIQVYFG